jgi:hypothetical protein
MCYLLGIRLCGEADITDPRLSILLPESDGHEGVGFDEEALPSLNSLKAQCVREEFPVMGSRFYEKPSFLLKEHSRT